MKRVSLLYNQDTLNSPDGQADNDYIPECQDGNLMPLPELNRKRREDFTIEELQQLNAFQQYNGEQLTQLLETLKYFTRTVLQLQKREQAQRKSIELKPSIDQTKKAA